MPVWQFAVHWKTNMAADNPHDARLNFRLPADLKTTIEEAAACLGQSVSDFAVSTLAQTARNVIAQHIAAYSLHEHAFVHERTANGNAVREVDSQDCDGNPADRGQCAKYRPIPLKVIAPTISSWIK